MQGNFSILSSILCLGRSKKKAHCLNEELYPLEETKACPCDELLSQPYGNWSACILPDPSAPGSVQSWMSHREVKECGQGLRYRAVACIDQRGNPVNPTLCTDTGRIFKYRRIFTATCWPFTSLQHCSPVARIKCRDTMLSMIQTYNANILLWRFGCINLNGFTSFIQHDVVFM